MSIHDLLFRAVGCIVSVYMAAQTKEMDNAILLDVVSQSSPEDKLAAVQNFSPEFSHGLLLASFRRQAVLQNDNPQEPFIVFEPMNRAPEAWVAAAKFKIAAEWLREAVDSVVFLPRSCTWERSHCMIMRQLRENTPFSDARFPLALREEQIRQDASLAGISWEQADITSYTRNRQADGTRGTAPIFFEHPPEGYGRRTLLVDDALAAGSGADEAAEFLKNRFGVQEVYLMPTMAKRMEGGIDRLQASHFVDGYLLPIVVDRVDTQTKGIFVEPKPLIVEKASKT